MKYQVCTDAGAYTLHNSDLDADPTTNQGRYLTALVAIVAAATISVSVVIGTYIYTSLEKKNHPKIFKFFS